MKVKELIRELSKYNIENEVVIVSDASGSFEIERVFVDSDVVFIEGS